MDDAGLVERVLAGDRHAVGVLVELLWPRLARLARQLCPHDPHLVEDLVQDAWMHLQREGWLVLRRWRREASLVAFLITVCRNRMRDRLQQERLRADRELSVDDPEGGGMLDRVDPTADVVRECWHAELRMRLEECLDRLPERDARLLRARYLEGRDPGEIAAAEGMRRNAVNVAIHRARERLEKLLVDECPDLWLDAPSSWVDPGMDLPWTPRW